MQEGIVIQGGKVGYRFFPKVACTSIKSELYRVEFNEVFDPVQKGLDVHGFFGKKVNKGDLATCDNRFLVFRDPIKKFISAYMNRVHYHKELSENYISNLKKIDSTTIPIFNPGIGQFIQFLDVYESVPSINWHVKPFVSFLTESLEFFTHVYKIEDLACMEDDLSAILGTKVVFSRQQSGGKRLTLKDLNSNQIEFLFDYYKDDYKLLKGMYSIDEIWKSWKKA